MSDTEVRAASSQAQGGSPSAPAESDNSTAELVEGALEKVDQDLARVNAALANVESAPEDPESTISAEGTSTALTENPQSELAADLSEPSSITDEETLSEPEPVSDTQADVSTSPVSSKSVTASREGTSLVCRVLRPFVGMLTLMDMPFAGVSHGSKSIIGHLAIATVLVAVMTWILRWSGYLRSM